MDRRRVDTCVMKFDRGSLYLHDEMDRGRVYFHDKMDRRRKSSSLFRHVTKMFHYFHWLGVKSQLSTCLLPFTKNVSVVFCSWLFLCQKCGWRPRYSSRFVPSPSACTSQTLPPCANFFPSFRVTLSWVGLFWSFQNPFLHMSQSVPSTKIPFQPNFWC